MRQPPAIVEIVTVPGLLPPAPGQSVPDHDGFPLLAVGLRLNDGHVAWGECLVRPDSPDELPATAETIDRYLAPRLQGQPVDRFRPLAAPLSGVTAPTVVTRALPPPSRSPGDPVSRRGLLTGQWSLAETPAPARVQRKVVAAPLAPAIMLGVTQALLQAVAHVHRQPPAAVLAREYGLPPPQRAVPLYLEVSPDQVAAARPILATAVAALGYTTDAGDPKAILGPGATRLQQHVRQVAAWVKTLPGDTPPAIHLNLSGGFTALYDNRPGPILGALVGLDKAAAPYHLRVMDPVTASGPASAIDLLRQLHGFLRLRRMQLELVATAGDLPLADLLAEATCHMVRLDLRRLGSLHEFMSAAGACRAQHIPILLSGGGAPTLAALVADVALAVQPALVDGPPALIYNAMQQTLAAIASRPNAGGSESKGGAETRRAPAEG